MSSPDLDAFISYRRSDGTSVARWLRRELQAFRMPRSLRARYGKPLRVYLDTAYERGTSDFYENIIRPAILSARWLIVVATPDARIRPPGVEDWIHREVADFSAGPNGRNVVAVRGAGEFNDPLPADLIERFPRIEIVDLRGASRLSFLNPVRAARLSQEKLKLIGALHDLDSADMPLLRQEEERTQQTRLGATMGASLGVLTAVSGLSVFAIYQQMRAAEALQESMFATGSMVLQSTNLDEGTSEATGGTRRLLIVQGCSLIDKLSASSAQKPQINEFVRCRLERAWAREKQGEHALALAQFEEAIGAAEQREAETERTEPGDRLLEARLAIADYHKRRNDREATTAALDATVTDSRRLQARSPKHTGYVVQEAEALRRLGDDKARNKDHAGSRDSYLGAAEAFGRAVEISGGERERERTMSQAWLLRRAAEQQQLNGEAASAATTLLRAISVAARVPDEERTPGDTQETAILHALLWEIEAKRGNTDEALKAKADALALIAQVLGSSETDPDLKAKAEKLRSVLGGDG